MKAATASVVKASIASVVKAAIAPVDIFKAVNRSRTAGWVSIG